MKKTLKKDRLDFQKKFKEKVLEYGANHLRSYRFEIDTVVGKLNLSVHESDEYGFNIYARFDDEKEACKYYDCNSHTGKYNLHANNKQFALDWLEDLLEEVVKGELILN